MCILAEITGNWDISGIFCLASILWFIIIACLYSPNPYFGSCSCAFIFFCVACFTGDGGFGGDQYITNESQTKWILLSECDRWDDKNLYHPTRSTGNGSYADSLQREKFIPEAELVVIDGWKKMKSTGKDPRSYTLIDKEFVDRNNSIGWDDGITRLSPTWYVYKLDGKIVKASDNTVATDDDYYIYNNPVSKSNVPSEAGGVGLPQWLYHPGSALWLFGLAGLPAIGVGGAAVSKMKD